jgi:hypothetical protein
MNRIYKLSASSFTMDGQADARDAQESVRVMAGR